MHPNVSPDGPCVGDAFECIRRPDPGTFADVDFEDSEITTPHYFVVGHSRHKF